MGKIHFYLFLYIVFLRILAAQEFLPLSPSMHVLDPFGSGHQQIEQIAHDSSFFIDLQLSYESLFGIKEIDHLGINTTVRMSRNMGTNLQLQYFAWGPFVNMNTETDFIYHVPTLCSAFKLGVKVRFYRIDPVVQIYASQINAGGIVFLREDFDIFWSVSNLMEWHTRGPAHGQAVLGFNYDLTRQLTITMGVENNYLYPMDGYIALQYNLNNTLIIGSSYLSEEREAGLFTDIKTGDFNFEVGYSYHAVLGSSYRSGVGVHF